MNVQEFIEELVENGLDNNTIINFVRSQQSKIDWLCEEQKISASIIKTHADILMKNSGLSSKLKGGLC